MEVELPRLLMEFLASDDAFSIDYHNLFKHRTVRLRCIVIVQPPNHPLQQTPPWGFALQALQYITRVWASMCQADGPPFCVMRPATEGLFRSVMCSWEPMWRNMRKHRRMLFHFIFCQDTYARHVIEIAMMYFNIKYMLTG